MPTSEPSNPGATPTPSWFSRFAHHTAHAAGKPAAFTLGVAIIVVWLATGPVFHYSDTWQLIINTGTTIVTFLMVFLLQHTQNRDTTAVQIKLNELIRAVQGAQNALVEAEDMDDEQLAKLQEGFHRLARAAGCEPTPLPVNDAAGVKS